MLNSTEHEISIDHKKLKSQNKNKRFVPAINHLAVVFIQLIEVKMPYEQNKAHNTIQVR